MFSYEKFDLIVQERFAQKLLIFDEDRQKIFSWFNGKLLEIGTYSSRDRKTCINLQVNNKSHRFPIERAAWIYYYGIPDKNKVVQKIEPTSLSFKDNLKLVDFVHPNRIRVRFTEPEINYIKDNLAIKTIAEISTELNRSDKSVSVKIRNLGFQKTGQKHRIWRIEEDTELKRLYAKNVDINLISKKLNRTIPSIRLRARRILKINRVESRTLKPSITRIHNFYSAIKEKLHAKTLNCKCCLCSYDLTIDLHHIDGNNKNHHISNIASLCPNHHREVELGYHKEKKLYAIWWRVYPGGRKSEIMNNLNEISKKAQHNYEKK